MSWAYDNSMKKYVYNQRFYNRNKNVRDFKVGDIVMIKFHSLSKAINKYNSKLDIKWQPAIILEKVFGNGYRVKTAYDRTMICDVSQIKDISLDLQEIFKNNEKFLTVD